MVPDSRAHRSAAAAKGSEELKLALGEATNSIVMSGRLAGPKPTHTLRRQSSFGKRMEDKMEQVSWAALTASRASACSPSSPLSCLGATLVLLTRQTPRAWQLFCDKEEEEAEDALDAQPSPVPPSSPREGPGNFKSAPARSPEHGEAVMQEKEAAEEGESKGRRPGRGCIAVLFWRHPPLPFLFV